jgi:hypothetical protein
MVCSYEHLLGVRSNQEISLATDRGVVSHYGMTSPDAESAKLPKIPDLTDRSEVLRRKSEELREQMDEVQRSIEEEKGQAPQKGRAISPEQH